MTAKGWGGPNGTHHAALREHQEPVHQGVDAFWKEFGGADEVTPPRSTAHKLPATTASSPKRPDRYYDSEARGSWTAVAVDHHIAARTDPERHWKQRKFRPQGPGHQVQPDQHRADRDADPTPPELSPWRDPAGRPRNRARPVAFTTRSATRPARCWTNSGLKAASQNCATSCRMKLDVARHRRQQPQSPTEP